MGFTVVGPHWERMNGCIILPMKKPQAIDSHKKKIKTQSFDIFPLKNKSESSFF